VHTGEPAAVKGVGHADLFSPLRSTSLASPAYQSRSNDLSVAVGRVEFLASLAHAFPPIRPEAVAGAIEVP